MEYQADFPTKTYLLALSFLLVGTLGTTLQAQPNTPPNVILVITDDQGYGDLGITGNPHVKTPNIDAFARSGTRLNHFYVSPVCAPTRASLMTGRYGLRTGIRDTYNGGAMMASSEITIAEMLKKKGYRTGLFGKWHLGDNYPFRPKDQGFDESLMHLSGGMGQVGDVTTYFKGDSSYFNPTLWHNGKTEDYKGYCSDIFAAQAIRFIEEHAKTPFFCYLAFNAPHTPLQLPDSYYQRYKDIDPASGFPKNHGPLEMSEQDKEDARKVYGMVSNIDDNMGKLLRKLDDLNLTDNTLVIFMTDNGPQQHRYIAGMRGRKGSVYNGGVRVPCYVRYPASLKANRDIDATTAHIDILPTLAAICGADLPQDRIIDGKNLWPLLQGQKADGKERTLFFYWTRRYPELYNNMALLQGPYKLVGHTDYNARTEDFELFHIDSDPFETRNLSRENLDIAQRLRQQMDRLFQQLIASENLTKPPQIILGDPHENPLILNRNDAGGDRGIWDQEEIFGHWNVDVREGHYNFTFQFIQPIAAGGIMYLETRPLVNQMRHEVAGTRTIVMKNVYLPAIEGDLIPFYTVHRKKIFPFSVTVEKID